MTTAIASSPAGAPAVPAVLAVPAVPITNATYAIVASRATWGVRVPVAGACPPPSPGDTVIASTRRGKQRSEIVRDVAEIAPDAVLCTIMRWADGAFPAVKTQAKLQTVTP